ncbi:MAG: pitrilysin family protein [Pseudomonadota bacterium]
MLFLLGMPTAGAAAVPKAREARLHNGLRVVMSPQHGLSLVSLAMVVADGSRSDPLGHAGLASLTSALLREGTPSRGAEQLANEVDFLGATLSADTDFDFTIVATSMLAKDFDKALAIFADVLRRPTFPEEEVSRKRQELLAGIEAEQQDPGRVANRAFLAALYGDEAPYGHPPEGSDKGLKACTRKNIVSHYQRFYLPNNCILVAVGDFEDEVLLQRLESAFGDWPQGEVPRLEPPRPASPTKSQVLINQPISQANVTMGRMAIQRSDPDFYALQVGNYILGGGGFSSRLIEEVRVKRGLAYSVSSNLNALTWPGSLEVTMQTSNPTAQEAIDIVRAQTGLMAEQPVKPEELKAAKQYLVGSFPLKLDSNTKLTRYLALVSFYGLGLDYAERYPALIESQTPESILAAWKRKVASHEPTTVVVANLSAAGFTD